MAYAVFAGGRDPSELPNWRAAHTFANRETPDFICASKDTAEGYVLGITSARGMSGWALIAERQPDEAWSVLKRCYVRADGALIED